MIHLGNIKLQSDFSDYYDSGCMPPSDTASAHLVYKRFRSALQQSRATELGELKKCGISTVEIRAVRNFSEADTDKVIVYTDAKKHNGEGKVVMSLNEARLAYPTSAACKFYTETDGRCFKIVSIGDRRFRVEIYRGNGNSLKEQEILNITEILGSLNYILACPVYSIDYIPTSMGMLATDFNKVQQLNTLNIDKFISGADVISCIHKALVAYNV